MGGRWGWFRKRELHVQRPERLEIAGREHGDCKQLKTGRDERPSGERQIYLKVLRRVMT